MLITTRHATMCRLCRYGAVETGHAPSLRREWFLYQVQRTVSFVEIKNTINSWCSAPIRTFDCSPPYFTHNAVRNRNVLMCCTTQKFPLEGLGGCLLLHPSCLQVTQLGAFSFQFIIDFGYQLGVILIRIVECRHINTLQ